MPKRFLLLVLAVVVSLSSALAYPAGSSAPQRSRSSSSSKNSKANSDKTVHVIGYYRKDGTYVKSYDRTPPGSKSSGASDAGTSLQKMPAAGSIPSTSSRDSRGRIKRSTAAKEEFERQSGYPHGRPGYVVDHIKPLACGGADASGNMQWQTVEEAKAKDKTERIGCK
jgi:hypothetical protein